MDFSLECFNQLTFLILESPTMFKYTCNSISSTIAVIIAVTVVCSSSFVNSLTIPEVSEKQYNRSDYVSRGQI